ncbi:MAG: hypothetical protein P4N41_15415 [Negativicutes bacterium]|nr:hypothetical protein [Negativicutes bacterium]
MTAVNSVSSVNYDPTMTSYSTDLALLNASGLSTGSTATSAYSLDGSLAALNQTAATSDTTQTSPTGINPAAYTLPAAFTDPDLLNKITPAELSYLMGLPSNQSTATTSTQSTSGTTETGLYAPSAAGVNPLGDPITWQIGDDTLYQMDPALASVIDGPTSSASAYSQSQDTATVGTSVDTSA